MYCLTKNSSFVMCTSFPHTERQVCVCGHWIEATLIALVLQKSRAKTPCDQTGISNTQIISLMTNFHMLFNVIPQHYLASSILLKQWSSTGRDSAPKGQLKASRDTGSCHHWACVVMKGLWRLGMMLSTVAESPNSVWKCLRDKAVQTPSPG
jgi:hypothetical protein